jgi:hypothetical protein
MISEKERDPRHHTRKMAQRLQEIVQHLAASQKLNQFK